MSKKYRFNDRELENAILSAKNVYEGSLPFDDWLGFFDAMDRGGVSDAFAKDQLAKGLGALMAAGAVDLGKAKAIYYATFPKKMDGGPNPRLVPLPERGGKELRWIQRSAAYYAGGASPSASSRPRNEEPRRPIADRSSIRDGISPTSLAYWSACAA